MEGLNENSKSIYKYDWELLKLHMYVWAGNSPVYPHRAMLYFCHSSSNSSPPPVSWANPEHAGFAWLEYCWNMDYLKKKKKKSSKGTQLCSSLDRHMTHKEPGCWMTRYHPHIPPRPPFGNWIETHWKQDKFSTLFHELWISLSEHLVQKHLHNLGIECSPLSQVLSPCFYWSHSGSRKPNKPHLLYCCWTSLPLYCTALIQQILCSEFLLMSLCYFKWVITRSNKTSWMQSTVLHLENEPALFALHRTRFKYNQMASR